jgi:hypothetical protein
MTANTDTDRQALRKWCIELATQQPLIGRGGPFVARQTVTCAAAFEAFVLGGSTDAELEALLTKAEGSWR